MSAAFDREIPTDLFKTLPPEELAAAGHIIDVREAVVVVHPAVGVGGAGNPQLRHLDKPLQEEGEKLLIEAQIRIEVADDVVGSVAQLLVPGVERSGLPRKVPAFSTFEAKQFNPGMELGVLLNDLVGSIR